MDFTTLFGIFHTKGWDPEISCDQLTNVGTSHIVVYRVKIVAKQTTWIGIATGDPKTALFNAMVDSLQQAGVDNLEKQPEGAVCPIGRFRGLRITQCPVEFIHHWSLQEITGGDLDVWIFSCRTIVRNEN